jgi:hypothetical protein
VALRDRVTVVGDEDVSDTAARLRIHANGQVHAAQADILTPIAPAVIAGRLRAKAAALLGGERAARLWQAVEGVERDGPVPLLTSLGEDRV